LKCPESSRLTFPYNWNQSLLGATAAVKKILDVENDLEMIPVHEQGQNQTEKAKRSAERRAKYL